MTAIGCRAATAGVTRRPVSGARDEDRRRQRGGGRAAASGEAVAVGTGVPVGVRVAVGVATAVAWASGDGDGGEALSAFAPTPITSAARATTPTVPTMVFCFTPVCASSTDSDPIGRTRVTVGLGPVCPAQDSGGRRNRSVTLALERPAR